MARTTDPCLRNQSVYSIFIRNHSSSGDFNGLISDLDRISDLGVEIIWLLPIHPIGTAKRKGTAGSPYAISDYRAINPEYGSMDDFTRFIDATHERNLKVVIGRGVQPYLSRFPAADSSSRVVLEKQFRRIR